MFKLWMDIEPLAEVKPLLAGQVELIGPAADPAAAYPLWNIEEADAAIVRTIFPGNEATFRQAPRLKVIARTGIGYDNIDLEAATRQGICVVNAPEAPTNAVAEFAFALILAIARRVVSADRQIHAGIWAPIPDLIGFELNGRTLGLVGFGRTGTRVAEIARAFHMSVLAYDPYINPDFSAQFGVGMAPNLAALLTASDIVSLHLPLTPQTRGLIGQRELALMKPGTILINLARGPIVDEDALLAALERGHLAGAGIDVWGLEPLPAGSKLARSEHVLGTPHIAGTTRESMVRAQTAAAQAALMVLRGEQPPTLVNPQVWATRKVDPPS